MAGEKLRAYAGEDCSGAKAAVEGQGTNDDLSVGEAVEKNMRGGECCIMR